MYSTHSAIQHLTFIKRGHPKNVDQWSRHYMLIKVTHPSMCETTYARYYWPKMVILLVDFGQFIIRHIEMEIA